MGFIGIGALIAIHLGAIPGVVHVLPHAMFLSHLFYKRDASSIPTVPAPLYSLWPFNL